MRKSSRLIGSAVAASVGLAVSGWCTEAAAQTLEVAGTVEVGSGIEGGGQGDASGVRRARTLLRVGADAYVDEFPKDNFSFGLLLEMEPHTAAGADVRYMRLVGDYVALHIGAIGFIVPDTLWGVEAGATVRIPLSETIDLTAGPNLPVFFLGGDLPEGSVIFQALVLGGIRIEL